MTKTLYIIDGHAHIYAAYFAPLRGQLTGPSGEPTKATYIFTTAILGLIERQRPDLLVVAMDSKCPTFRHQLYPEYKAHRPPMPEDMPIQIDRIEQILAALRIPVMRVDGFEADDVMGTLAKRAGADGYECFICSKDKDILQLLDDRIRIFDMKTGQTTTAETLRQEMGVTARQFLDVLALQGDASDNVPGVADVGPKTALEWIRQYGSIEDLLVHADQIPGKRGQSLRASQEVLRLSKRLVTIDCEVPLAIDYDRLAIHPPDKEQLASVFTELGFGRLLSQLNTARAGSATTQDKAQPLSELASLKTTDHQYHLVDTPDAFDAFIGQLGRQRLFALDTETTSVDPMRADLVGMSFCWEIHHAFYLPLKGPLGARCLDRNRVRPALAPILADPQVHKVGQNIKYDSLVLRNAGLPVAGFVFDTMVASYCLDPGRLSHSMDSMAVDFLHYQPVPITDLIGKGKHQTTFDAVDTRFACEYSAEDADVTFQLYGYLTGRLDREPLLKQLFDQVEMPLVEVLAEMEHHGVSLDVRRLRDLSGRITEALGLATDEIYRQAGCTFNPDSPKQLAEVLFDRLHLASGRMGKTGRSTDAAVLEDLVDEHPIVSKILEYRQLSKLKNTYVDKLGLLIHHRTGRVHTSFNQTVTATGRLSSSDPNLQNIPIRTELGRQIRSAFVAEKASDCILSADYSQIELRLLAHFSQDRVLLDAFAADQDIHRFVAAQIYGVPPDQVTSEMRSRCKAVNFGIIYGQGAQGLAAVTGMGVGDARQFIEDYYLRYHSIRSFMDGVVEQARKTGFVETILHRRRALPGIHSKNPGKSAQARRFAVNTVIQGSAADLIKKAMISIHRRILGEGLPVRMILQVHDELVFEVPTDQASLHAQWIVTEMTHAMELSVPLKVDVTYGPSWMK